jgi:hypothetical protein
MAVMLFTCGVVAVGPAYAQRRDGNILPPEANGTVIVAGCLTRGTIRGGDDDDYVLAHPTIGPVRSVPEARCTADPGANALELEDADDYLDDSMLGRWIEVTGEMEKETSSDPDNLRELDVDAARIVPVVPPRAAAAPAPERPAVREQPVTQQPQQSARVEPIPEAPTSLPKTASPVPAIGLFGLFSLAGGLVLRSFRFRRPE